MDVAEDLGMGRRLDDRCSVQRQNDAVAAEPL